MYHKPDYWSQPTDISEELLYEEDVTIEMSQSSPCGYRVAPSFALVKVRDMVTDPSQRSPGVNKCSLKTACIHSGKPYRDTSCRLLKYLEWWSSRFTS